MKTLTKRLLSLALAVVMMLALIPMNALPAQAEGELTVTAYPKKVAVGQNAELTVTGATGELTYETSSAAIASVNSDGVVTGVHSGTATITVTDSTGAKGTYDMMVTATSTYVMSVYSFNVGNDTDGDEYPDQFGRELDTYGLSKYADEWTDAASKTFIPYSITNADRGARARNNGCWYLYPGRDAYGDDEFLDNYDYLNLNNSAPWCFDHNSNVSNTGTYIQNDIFYITGWSTQKIGSLTDDNLPYLVLKLVVPHAGNYQVDVSTTKAKNNAHFTFYMMPVEGTAATKANFVDSTRKIGRLDGTINTSGSYEFTAPTAGEYYFVAELNDDGSRHSEYTTATAFGAYVNSISLTLDELDDLTLTTKTSLTVGASTDLKVTQTGSFSGQSTINATFENNNPDVVRLFVNDGVATVTAVGEGTATVTVKYTDLLFVPHTDVVTYTVDALEQLNYVMSVYSFNVGNDTDGDGYPDQFGRELNTYGFSKYADDWTDATSKTFIPYSTEVADPGARARNNGCWYLYPMTNGDSDFLKNTYDYLNLNNTAPWCYDSHSDLADSYTYIQNDQFHLRGWSNQKIGSLTDNNRPYLVLKLVVPNAGNYQVDVTTSVGKANAHFTFFMMPVEGTAATKANFIDSTKKIGRLDGTINASGSYEFTAPTAGEYYFVAELNDDGSRHSEYTTETVFDAYINAITLTPVAVDVDGCTVQQSATLRDDITMNFTVNATGSMIKGYDVTLDGTELGFVPVETGVNKTITVALAANQMSKVIKLQPVDANGDNIGDASEYSLGEYLLFIINSNETQMTEYGITEADKTMAKYTYNYCAKAQIYANKDVEKLDNSITVEINEPESWQGTTADIVSGTTAGITAKSATLLLENKITQRVYFTLGEGANLADYVFTVDGAPVNAKSEGGKYFVDIEGINPQDYDIDRVVRVTKANEGDLTVTYRPLDYIQRTYYNTDKENLQNLVLALYGYYKAAEAYVN